MAACRCQQIFDVCRFVKHCEAYTVARMGLLPVKGKLELLRSVVADIRLLLCPLAEGTSQALPPVNLCLQLLLAGEAPLQPAIALELQKCKPPRSQMC